MDTLAALVLGTAAVAGLVVLTAAWLVVRSLRRVRARLRRRVEVALGHGPAAALSARYDRALAGRRLAVLERWLPGPARTVPALRRDLHRDVQGALHAVAVGARAGRPVEELAVLAGRLRARVGALDVDLAVLAAEPDENRRQVLLAGQQERVEQVRRGCAQVRQGVLLAGAATSGEQLGSADDLAADLADEVSRLGFWAGAHRELRTR
ncbi:MAG: hypothetical protein WCD35_15395 [Mycobacteriales bacterium]